MKFNKNILKFSAAIFFLTILLIPAANAVLPQTIVEYEKRISAETLKLLRDEETSVIHTINEAIKNGHWSVTIPKIKNFRLIYALNARGFQVSGKS